MSDSAKPTVSDVIFETLSSTNYHKGMDAQQWTKDEGDAYEAAENFTKGREAVRKIQSRKLADKIAAALTEAGFSGA